MSFAYKLRLSKKLSDLSVEKNLHSFLPNGSFSSIMDSVIVDDNLKSEYENSITDETIHNTCHIIPYESICLSDFIPKETQTDHAESSSQEIQELGKIISKLISERNSYAKQNEDLKKEIKTAVEETESNSITSLKDEVKRLKGKLTIHQSMLEKVISFTEEICDETPTKNVKYDFSSYNYLISKLEIVNSRLKRYANKVKLLENDKASLTELLDFYSSAVNVQARKSKKMRENISPDFDRVSKKNSRVLECSTNSIRTPPEDENDTKKSSLQVSKVFESKPTTQLGKTLKNLRGIKKLIKSGKILKKLRNRNSQSVSPLLARPKKSSSKNIGSKENSKSNTIKLEFCDHKRKHKRCRS